MKHEHKRREHVLLNGIEYKECASCLALKTLDNYTKDSYRWDKLYYTCQPCQVAANSLYRENNSEKKSTEEVTRIRSEAAKKSTAQRVATLRSDGGLESLIKARSKPVVAKSVISGEERTYPSAKLAEVEGFSRKDICRAIKSGKQHKGFFWRFV